MTELNDLLSASAWRLATAIRQGETTSAEVVDAHLRRIDAVNPTLNAVVALNERAVEDARTADQALLKGQPVGPLHGVPFTVKDWIETAGLVCAAGDSHRADFVPEHDAAAVARLRAAGAILLGKTKPGSSADIHPAPRNPYRTTQSPGASSSGEAALIAARSSPLGLGSDSGGSLRWPAHCCGISTIKPSSGVVPLTGHYPPTITMTDPRTVIGPMARCVRDLELALSIIRGPDGSDPSAVPLTPIDPAEVSLKTLRVARFETIGTTTADPATHAALDSATSALQDAGAQVVAASPPDMDQAMPLTKAYWARPESNSLKRWRPDRKSTLSADEVEQSLFEWDRFRRTMLTFMADYDIMICPVAAEPAPAREEASAADYAFTVPFSLTGYPCVVIPAALAPDGLPIGIQIVARLFDDHVALAVAGYLERALTSIPAPEIP